MPIGLIGTKIGMSHVFTDDGKSISVTVVQIPANCVTQVKTVESDGYMALQLASGECNPAHLSKASAGHYAKHQAEEKGYMYSKEFRINEKELRGAGEQLDLRIFASGQKVKVTSNSKGKGFAGTIKRHNFRGQDKSHGNSLSHRVAGAVGQCQTPGKVFKGKKMAGRMGGGRTTLINCEVVEVDLEKELLMLKGSVPGAIGGRVIVQHQEHIDLDALIEPEPQEAATPADATSEEQAPQQADEPDAATEQDQPATDSAKEAATPADATTEEQTPPPSDTPDTTAEDPEQPAKTADSKEVKDAD